jgi:6,7-dimethyl-8-ribityllumazine synthase
MSLPILIVVAPYYQDISDALLAGARAQITRAGHTHETVSVPGALEIPATIALAATSRRYAAYVALGCVLRGETTHYDTVANESARGLMQLAITQHLAIGNGILTCETHEQALVRAAIGQGNKGGEAAHAALALLALRAQFGLESRA